MKKIAGLNLILLLDDDEATNFYHKSVIEDSGLDVSVLSITSVKKALNYLKKEGDYTQMFGYARPDLIFLDINLPGMSGWDFLREYEKLNEQQRARSVIIMLTTSQNPDDFASARAYTDVNDFLFKPLTEEMLWDVIHRNTPRFSEMD